MKIFGIELRGFREGYTRRNPSPFRDDSASGFYKRFHYQPAKVKRFTRLPEPPNEAFVIGRLLNLTYLPFDSSGKPHEPHIHRFGDYGYKEIKDVKKMPILLGDNKHNLWIERGNSKFFLNERGIVG